MKKLFLNALFIGLATLGYAQTAFTEKTLEYIHQAFIANPPKTVAERTLPNFTMLGSDGRKIDYTVFKSWNVAGAGLEEWPTSDVKVQQAGNLAIATGITKHRPKSAKAAFHQRFTETYEFQNGQWKLASAHYTDIAPPAFTEQTLTDLHKEVIADGKKHFNERFSPNYEMTLPDGTKMDYATMKNFVGQRTVLEWPVQDVKIRQTGNIAIITGIRSPLSLIHETNQKIRQYQRFTSISEYQNGKWMNLSSHYTNISPTKADEEAAIQKTIEDEGHEFHYNTDRNSFLSFWNMTDATRMVYSGKTGLIKLTAKDMKDAAEKGVIPKADNQNSTFSNYVIRVNGNVSWVTNDQTDSKGILYHEVRCLEKIAGVWKIVSSSVHDTDR
jgi:hypothetical protein